MSTGGSFGSNNSGGIYGSCGGGGGSNTVSGGLSNVTGSNGSSNEIASHSFESRIDKMRRFISSPLTRRKSTSQASTESSSSSKSEHHKIFGTPIEKLTHQRSFNEMSSSTCLSSTSASTTSASLSTSLLSASSYCSINTGSTLSGIQGNLLTSSSNALHLTTSTSTSTTLSPHNSNNNNNNHLINSKSFYDKDNSVPFVITRLCHYIEDSQGLMQEGLFRTSGNARLIEKLKTSFDTNGDAPLETEGDIPSAAALLKLFLRELPVPLIPQSIHSLFLDTVQEALNQGGSYDKDAFIARLKMLVENLPDENYFLLKYLSRFLHQVARHEAYNRMTPASLGIIFGPNIFRVAAEDYKGLREQSLTNQVVTFFITDYQSIFGKDSPDKEEKPLVTATETTTIGKNSKADTTILSTSPVITASRTSDQQQQQQSIDSVNKSKLIPLHVDILPVDCETASYLSNSPNPCGDFSEGEDGSKEFLLVINESKPGRTNWKKRKDDMKYILSSSSPVIRSSSEERKSSASQSHETRRIETFQEIRRCSSYSEMTKSEEGEDSGRDDRPVSNLSTGSVSQPPEPKRREVERKSKKLTGSTLSFESRPSSLDLSCNNNSASQPEIHNFSVDTKKVSVSETSTAAKTTITGILVESQGKIEPSNKKEISSNDNYYSKESRRGNNNNSSHSVHKSLAEGKSHNTPPSNEVRKKFPISGDSNSKENEPSNLPHIDLSTLHKNAETDSAMVSDLRYSWSSTNDSLSSESLRDNDDDDSSETPSDQGQTGTGNLVKSIEPHPVQNAAMTILKRRNTYEAPLSPSAYRGFLGQRAPHLDHTIPPSPPGEQEHHFHGNKGSFNHESAVIKEAKKKIHTLKRRLKQFEKDFEKESGYRPSHEQKMKSDIAQPLMFELNKYRKILRELKDDARMTTEFYEDVYHEMQKNLKERRCVVGRPEIIEAMSVDQIFEEKLDLQKSLLKYESVFGRPTRKEDRAVMKPLYDRYRTIRNLVAKIPKNKDSTDLQPILENVAMNFSSPSHSPKNSSAKESVVEEKEKTEEEKSSNNENEKTREEEKSPEKSLVNLVKPLSEIGIKPESISHHHQQSHKLCHNLHELPPAELVKELNLVRREKAELRKIIRTFEEEFHRTHGRKIAESEKFQMESVYNNYKASKKKLRLLEVFIEKYEKRKMDF